MWRVSLYLSPNQKIWNFGWFSYTPFKFNRYLLSLVILLFICFYLFIHRLVVFFYFHFFSVPKIFSASDQSFFRGIILSRCQWGVHRFEGKGKKFTTWLISTIWFILNFVLANPRSCNSSFLFANPSFTYWLVQRRGGIFSPYLLSIPLPSNQTVC